MSFAAKQVRWLSNLASLSLMGWSVAAMAQPAPKPPASEPPTAAAKERTTSKAPPGANQPAAGRAPVDKKAQPAAPKVRPLDKASTSPPATDSKSTKASDVPAADANALPAGSATKPQQSAPADGESWVPASTAHTPAPAGAAGATASPKSPWPDQPEAPVADSNGAPMYYVERAPVGDGRSGPSAQANRQLAPPPDDVEPMNLPIEEPPVPAPRKHAAPRSALWLGARVGYFVPFGDLWGQCVGSAASSCDRVEGSSFSDVAASGPMFELDVGARLGRNYIVYLGWERAQLGSAEGPSPDASVASSQSRSESDFLAVGFRLSADPDDIGLLLDLAIGARRFRAYYEGSTELQLTQAPLESRLGVGVDIRTNRKFSLSPMLTLGIGSFGKAEWVNSMYVQSAVPDGSDRLTHGWLTLQLGGHFDIAGSD